MSYRGLLKQHATLFNTVQYLCDWLAVLLSAFLSYQIYDPITEQTEIYVFSALLSLILAMLIFPRFGLYQIWRGISFWDEVKAVFIAWLTIITILIVLAFLTKAGALFSRGWLTLWAISGLCSIIILRLSVRILTRWLRLKGYNQRHIVLVGNIDLAHIVAERLENAAWIGFSIRGLFSDSDMDDANGKDLICLGGLAELHEYIADNDIDQVWLTMSLRDEDKVHKVLHDLRHTTVDIRFIPDIFGLRLINHSIMEIAGLPILNLSVTPMTGINKLLKSLEDKVLSLIILLMISPLMVLIAIAIKLSSKGPVFYKQERVGWNGKTFNILKFRSMPVDSEKQGVKWGTKGKQTTKLGTFIRKTSIDELPQFINVLRGDMSIVGPRPERTVFVEELKDEIPGYMKKHLVKAGITGWAQANGWRGDTDLHKRIEYDLYYIENWSLWLDIKIIIMTIYKGFVNKNAC